MKTINKLLITFLTLLISSKTTAKPIAFIDMPEPRVRGQKNSSSGGIASLLNFKKKPKKEKRIDNKDVNLVITLQELNQNLSILSEKEFLKKVEDENVDGARLYKEYLKEEYHRAFGKIIFERALDNESLALNVPYHIPHQYVGFALEYILKNNATNLGENPNRSFPELYSLLLNLIESAEKESEEGLNDIKFKIDWKDRSINGPGMYSIYFRPSDTQPVTLKDMPRVRLVFKRKEDGSPLLPSSFQEFEMMLREQLQPVYRQVVREYTWKVLTQLVQPVGMHYATDLNIIEKADKYEELKDELFSFNPSLAKVIHITFAGEQRKQAKDLYLNNLKKKVKHSLADIKTKFDKDENGAVVPEQMPQFQALKKEIESQLPIEALDAIKEELASLNASFSINEELIGESELKESNYSELRKRKLAKFFGMESMMTFFPHSYLSEEKEEFYFFLGMESGQRQYYDSWDDNVRNVVESRLRSPKILKVYARVFEEVMRYYYYNMITNTCSIEADLPCLEHDESRLMDQLQGYYFGSLYGAPVRSEVEKVFYKKHSQEELAPKRLNDFFRMLNPGNHW